MLMASVQVGGLSEAQVAARVQAFLDAVDGIPTWAIAAARRAWNRADPDLFAEANFAYPPTAPQFARACRAVLSAVRGEAYRLQRLLNAETRP